MLNTDIGHFSATLRHVISDIYTRVFVVIDALDECQHPKVFLTEIFTLQANTGANLFATSRPKNDIQREFASSLYLEIYARDEDVKKYIDGRIFDLGILNEENEDLREEVKTKLKMEIEAKVTEAVNGM